MSEPLVIGTNCEASADVSTAGDKILELHELLEAQITDAEFRAQTRKLLGPKP